MTHVYDGPPDGRQSADQHMPTTRFRPIYRALSDREKALHDQIKQQAEHLENLFKEVETLRNWSGLEPQARYAALAITYLEIAIMFAIKGLTAA